MVAAPYRIGVDLGGTKTEVVVVDGAGVEHVRRRVPSARDAYDGTLSVIRDLVADAERDCRAATGAPIGVGIPGSISKRTGRVKNANSTWLNRRPLAADLKALFPGRDVVVANDANCLALSEATDGAGAGYDLVFAAILGTGCGAGLAYRRQVLPGANGVAGEWGHNPLPWDDDAVPRQCYCGRTNCIEMFLSGPALTETYATMTAGARLSAKDIVQLADDRPDSDAGRALDAYLDALTKSLASVINVVDPDAIVLGGGMSNCRAIYDRVPASLERFVFGGECETPVRPARHGDSSGVRGAAWLNP
ncbi:Fructokinase [Plasmodiophora brassicae]